MQFVKEKGPASGQGWGGGGGGVGGGEGLGEEGRSSVTPLYDDQGFMCLGEGFRLQSLLGKTCPYLDLESCLEVNLCSSRAL